VTGREGARSAAWSCCRSKRRQNMLPKHEGHATGAKHEAAGGKHGGHNLTMFVRKFWVSLALTLPVVVIFRAARAFSEAAKAAIPGSAYLPFILGSIVFSTAAGSFCWGAARELKARLPGMMTLIGVAIVAAYSFSVYVTFSGRGMDLYWELTTLITVMLWDTGSRCGLFRVRRARSRNYRSCCRTRSKLCGAAGPR